jgi:hypothetical protein
MIVLFLKIEARRQNAVYSAKGKNTEDRIRHTVEIQIPKGLLSTKYQFPKFM